MSTLFAAPKHATNERMFVAGPGFRRTSGFYWFLWQVSGVPAQAYDGMFRWDDRTHVVRLAKTRVQLEFPALAEVITLRRRGL